MNTPTKETTYKHKFETKRKERDIELVNNILSGKPSKAKPAQDELYKAYFGVFLNYMQRNVQNQEDAEDLAITALTKALTQLDKYNQEFAFSTWLQKIAKNLLIDFKRKVILNVQSFESIALMYQEYDSVLFEVASKDDSPVEYIIRKEKYIHVNNQMSKLNKEYLQLLKLRYFQELSYEEISNKLDIPLGTVKAKIFRAKKELEQKFSEFK